MFAVELQLDWLPNAQFAGILYAQREGWYRQAGIDLTILDWTPYTNQVDALASDRTLLVSTEDNLLIRARSKGAPVKAIGVMMQFSGIGWMALADSGIQSIPDLRGKRLGIHPDGEAAIQLALRHYGMAWSDVEIQEVGYDYATLLMNRQVDAMQCLLMVEPLEVAALGQQVNTIRGFDLGYQVYAQVIATTDRLVEQHGEELVRFLQVTFDGWRAAFANPTRAAEIVVADYLPDANPQLQAQMLIAMQPIFTGAVGLHRLGWMERERWLGSIAYLHHDHLLDRPVQPEEVMTNHLIERLYQTTSA
jgi:ABC-type nitrate/sulfonate/bicarbonate transport system substrate-binding protein